LVVVGVHYSREGRPACKLYKHAAADRNTTAFAASAQTSFQGWLQQHRRHNDRLQKVYFVTKIAGC